MDKDEILFYVTVCQRQEEDETYINRRLTDSEIEIAKKGFESGILFDINIVFDSVLSEFA